MNNSPYTELFAEVDVLKAKLDQRRPLIQRELQRLRYEFLIEYAYNSNTIEGNTLTLQETALVLEQMVNLIVEFAGNKKLYPIERAVMFHLKFEGIHPFVDGNGRTGRLILNLMLMQDGYPPINVKYSDRKRYYDTFDSYYRDNDKSVFIYLIAELLKEQLLIYAMTNNFDRY